MGVGNGWTDLFGCFNASPYRDLSQFQGKRFAVDISILLNQSLSTDIAKLSVTCNPTYPSFDLLQSVMATHRALAKWIEPVYVFDGVAPPAKNLTKDTRLKDRIKAGKDWFDLHKRAVTNTNSFFTDEEHKKSLAGRLKTAHPTACDHANVLTWMQKEGIEVRGSLFEADQQMVKLEKDGIVDGVISEDGDIVVLGANLLLTKMSRKSNGEMQFKVFNRDVFMATENIYRSKVCVYPEMMADAALLLGNDYFKRIKNNGAATVLGSWPKIQVYDEKKGKMKNVNDTSGMRQNDGMIDKLAAAPDPLAWVYENGNNGTGAIENEDREIYLKARQYMLHAPVLEYCKDTDEVKILPLNALPEGESDWVEYFGSDFGLGPARWDVGGTLKAIYKCDILPLTRASIGDYRTPSREDGKPCAIFEELDFAVDPISVQPRMCLVNWLRARGVDVRMSDPRREIEDVVRNSIRVNKVVSDDPLQPITGTPSVYTNISARTSNNDYDNWNPQYLNKVKSIQFVDDEVINEHIGEKRKNRPSIRRRVKMLLTGGNYYPKTMKCRNMKSKENGDECILICCECLSSRKNLIHNIYAVFEDKPGGRYLKNLSSCSCTKGQEFCSHSIGFLYLVSIIQRRVSSQEELEESWKVNPQLIHSVPMLVENAVIGDIFNRQLSQRKRQRTT